jgi:hypothetical protein
VSHPETLGKINHISFSSHVVIEQKFAFSLSQLVVSLTVGKILCMHAIIEILPDGYCHVFSPCSIASLPSRRMKVITDQIAIGGQYAAQPGPIIPLGE